MLMKMAGCYVHIVLNVIYILHDFVQFLTVKT